MNFVMGKLKLALEFAKIPISIEPDNDFSFNAAKKIISQFQSSQPPLFKVKIETRPDPDYIYPRHTEEKVNTFKKDQKIIFYLGSDINKTIGVFDIEKKKAVFYNLNDKVTALHLSPFIRAVSQLFLFDNNGFILHSSGINHDNHGYIFAGPSGAGKTTAANLSAGSKIISDEFICLRKIESDYFIFPTPWKGVPGEGVRLKAIFFPKKARKLWLKKNNSADVFEELLPNILLTYYDQDIFTRLLSIVYDLSAEVPCYSMHFGLDSNIIEGLVNAA